MNERCVAFIDLLGFTPFIKTYSEDTIRELLKRMDIICNIMYYAPEFNDNKDNVFEHYLPASDSVFITAKKEEANSFIEQLSRFFISCFNLNSYFSNKRKDQLNTKMKKKIYKKYEIVKEEYPKVVLPLLFRGGVSFDEINIMKSSSIINYSYDKTPNIFGRGVINAVKLEKSHKEKNSKTCRKSGPKLYIDDKFHALLDKEHKQFVDEDDNGQKHYLWPVHMIEKKDKNKEFDKVFNDKKPFLQSVKNLLCYWETGSDVHAHYLAYIELLKTSMRKGFIFHFKDSENEIATLIDNFFEMPKE